MEIRQIAHIVNGFPEKFGIPRQSGLVPEPGVIVFEPEFRNPDMLRGLEEFSHIWLLWEFSANRSSEVQAVVRPPRLGGNRTMGVFATRSPYRPNPLGLSCVELQSVLYNHQDGPVLLVRGADLMNGTPIYDIKPYIRYADCHDDALCGYVDSLGEHRLEVVVPDSVARELEHKPLYERLLQVLSLDPRPSYHDDPERIYGMTFNDYNIHFRVSGSVLTVIDVAWML